MNYASSAPFDSLKFTGVRVVLKKRSAERRAKFNAQISTLNASLQTLQVDGEIAEAMPCPGCPHPVGKHRLFDNKCSVEGCECIEARGEGFAKRSHILVELSNMDRDKAQPERIRAFVKSIEGIDIDGAPATIDTLISDGPDELLDEIDEEIKRRLDLSEAERKNSESPTISGEAAGTATSDSTAPTASAAASGPTGTV